MWEQNPSPVVRTWEEALQYAQDLVLGGFTDWRLPNARELMSIINRGMSNTPDWLHTYGIVMLSSSPFIWTSTTYAPDAASAWGVAAATGNLYMATKESDSYVWAVRGGR
jgi:hypothetical protein